MSHDHCQHGDGPHQGSSATMECAIQAKKGERYGCTECAMEVEVTQSCDCDGPCVHLVCCGRPMQKR